jgi:transcriptional regulator with XRE-family HTH domain
MPRDGEFGAMLRTFRERVSPETAGIRPTWPAARRVPGLRRDELARLASVSEEHLKRLEQGRRRPSRAVVDALAGALRLDPPAHAQFSVLAGFAAPGRGPALQGGRVEAPQDGPSDQSDAGDRGLLPRQITAPARRLLDRLGEAAWSVCDASWTVLEDNRLSAELDCAGDPPGGQGHNVAWLLFTSPPPAHLHSAAQLTNVRSFIVADLRAAVRRYPADPQLRDLVTALHSASQEFRRLWAAAGNRQQYPDHMTIHHLSTGPLRVHKDVLTIEPGDLRVVIVTAAKA